MMSLLFFSCSTKEGVQGGGSLVDSVDGEESNISELTLVDESIEDPYLFSDPYSLHLDYPEVASGKPFKIKPIICFSSVNISRDEGRITFLEDSLRGFTARSKDGLSTLAATVIPYSVIDELLEQYLKKKAFIPNLPPNQWAAGMVGADAYVEVGFKEKITKDDLKLTFYSRSVMTGSGQILAEREQEYHYQTSLSRTELQKSMAATFLIFYHSVSRQTVTDCSALLSHGRYCRLILRNIPNDFDTKMFTQKFSERIGKVIQQKSEKSVIILDIWTPVSDLVFEKVFYELIDGHIDDQRLVDLVSQDRLSYIYEVELLDGLGG